MKLSDVLRAAGILSTSKLVGIGMSLRDAKLCIDNKMPKSEIAISKLARYLNYKCTGDFKRAVLTDEYYHLQFKEELEMGEGFRRRTPATIELEEKVAAGMDAGLTMKEISIQTRQHLETIRYHWKKILKRRGEL